VPEEAEECAGEGILGEVQGCCEGGEEEGVAEAFPGVGCVWTVVEAGVVKSGV